MTGRYRQTKDALWAISEEIYQYAYDHYRLPSDWHGVDLSIISKPTANTEETDGKQLKIVTSAAPEIAWLFSRLRDAFNGFGNDVSETEFYRRLARVARDHERASDREYNANGILRAVMDEAFAILEEIEKPESEPTYSVAEIDLALVTKLPRDYDRQQAAFC